ncbi:hypothetical protein LPMP_120830 [Leishmania panamensis]|uniref:Uncharacterized protein n=1 Tax=Leishmania panamensis TaxID=5679 RepID=A0A088RKQ2_LEIPA|nr:hypothetical protein LPMP_120830 [Leishmania panamensis]AIN96410.1 hypothetical protein LPMP_120830 [Leishmania panamensis]
MRHLLLEVKLPFMDVYLVETYLFHPTQYTHAIQAIDERSTSDARASMDQTCRKHNIRSDVTRQPPSKLPGVELESTPATRRVTSAAVSPSPSDKVLKDAKHVGSYPFKGPERVSERLRGGLVEKAALAETPPRRTAMRTTTAQAGRHTGALCLSPSATDPPDSNKVGVMNCADAGEAHPHPRPPLPRPPRSDEGPRPPARIAIVSRSAPTESLAPPQQDAPTALPLSLLRTMECVLREYKAALAVALRAVMHREAVWTALQQFLHVVRSDWAPLGARESPLVAPGSSQPCGRSNGAADGTLGSSGISGALQLLRSPRESGVRSGNMAGGTCRAEALPSPRCTLLGVSSLKSAAESECGTVERSSTPETLATLQPPTELTGTLVHRETMRSSSAPSLNRTTAPADSANRHGDAVVRTADCEIERHVATIVRPPHAAGSAERGRHPRRQQRTSLCLSVEVLQYTSAKFTGGAASAETRAMEGTPSYHHQSPPARTAPLLLRLPTSTPSPSTGAVRDVTGRLASARVRSAAAQSLRKLDREDSRLSTGEERSMHSVVAHRTLAVRHVFPALSGAPPALCPPRSAAASDGTRRRSQSAPCVAAAALHSPRPQPDSSFDVTPRVQITSRCDDEAGAAPSRTARSASDRGTPMAPRAARAYRSLQASPASPGPRQQESHGGPLVTGRSKSECAPRPHGGVVPSLGVRLHAVSRQVYAACLYHYLFYLQRTTLAVVEAVDELRRDHLTHAAPFVVEHRNYLLEVLMQTSTLTRDAAVKWLMHEATVDDERDSKNGGHEFPVAGQLSVLNSGAPHHTTPVPSVAQQNCNHAPDAKRSTYELLCTNSSRQSTAELTQDAEESGERAAQRAGQLAAARVQWPEQLLQSPLMSTHANLARYAATPRFLAQLESAQNTTPRAGANATVDTAHPSGADRGQYTVPLSTSPTLATLLPLRLVLPEDVLVSYSGDAATPEDERNRKRSASTRAVCLNTVPPGTALRKRLESGEHLLHLEVAAQLKYLQTCMQCALAHEYPLYLRGMLEVHRRFFEGTKSMAGLCGDAAGEVCATDGEKVDAAVTSIGTPATHGRADVTTARVRYDRVLLKDELLRADWMKELQMSWQLLMSGSSSVE